MRPSPQTLASSNRSESSAVVRASSIYIYLYISSVLRTVVGHALASGLRVRGETGPQERENPPCPPSGAMEGWRPAVGLITDCQLPVLRASWSAEVPLRPPYNARRRSETAPSLVDGASDPDPLCPEVPLKKTAASLEQ